MAAATSMLAGFAPLSSESAPALGSASVLSSAGLAPDVCALAPELVAPAAPGQVAPEVMAQLALVLGAAGPGGLSGGQQ